MRKNKTISILIILINLYFIPVSLSIILANGGPAGVSYYLLPFSILINLFFVSAVLSFKNDYEKRFSKINEIGIVVIVLVAILAILSIYFG